MSGNLSKPEPKRHDILCPSNTPGYFQHIGRAPNTNHQERQYEWRLKREEFEKRREQEGQLTDRKNYQDIKYSEHAKKRHFQRLIRDKVAEKLRRYEDDVEERRKRLKDLYMLEERQYCSETVALAQRQQARELEEMKVRAETLKKRREEERQAVVHRKRIEQYSRRCQELRPVIFKKNLMECKHAQLQQMRENEAKREAERELDRMWHELGMKEMRAKMEREEQELIERENVKKGMVEVWNKQIKGKELLREEVQKVAQEDRIEMKKLSEELRKEEIAALDEKRRKRDSAADGLLAQIREHELLLARRRDEEKAVDEAFGRLSELEDERARLARQDLTQQYRREIEMYKGHLEELKTEREDEERRLEELLEAHQKQILLEQDEAKCKLHEAKVKLQQSVLEGRAEQLAHKRQEAEEQLKLRRAENELLRMRCEQNDRLQAESDRLEAEAVRQYRDDLRKQIEYNNGLREKERQELERQLQEGLNEERKYQKIVEDMVKYNPEIGHKHPFRRVLERYECHCPSNVI